jgi:hypothetical protein
MLLILNRLYLSWLLLDEILLNRMLLMLERLMLMLNRLYLSRLLLDKVLLDRLLLVLNRLLLHVLLYILLL